MNDRAVCDDGSVRNNKPASVDTQTVLKIYNEFSYHNRAIILTFESES